MATTIEMPRMDMEMQEGTVARWLKTEGDSVAKGEVIAEIETDKAIVEVEAPTGGVLRQIAVEEGTTTPVGSVLGIITAPDEEMPTPDSLRPSSTETQRDTLSDDEQSIPLSRMRRVIAARTSKEYARGPPLLRHHRDRHDQGHRVQARIQRHPASRRPSQHSTTSSSKHAPWPSRNIPTSTPTLRTTILITSPHLNIGIAVALDQGLIIPAIPNCQDRDLYPHPHIRDRQAKITASSAHRGQGGTLKPDEYAGGPRHLLERPLHLLASNLGMYDVFGQRFTAIIYPPNARVGDNGEWGAVF